MKLAVVVLSLVLLLDNVFAAKGTSLSYTVWNTAISVFFKYNYVLKQWGGKEVEKSEIHT